jgi:putative colanic acid biosynthesis UDP-glucose lipid carrier transferase
VKPGMTGLAQVKGFYGPTASPESILLRYHWDIRYLHNMNWRMDTHIFLLTIVQRAGAFVSFAGRLLSHATGGGYRYAK